MAEKVISIDFYADFGILKKPDTNQPVYLTFNMLHKPAVLGIFGAILGLKGFQEPPKKAKGKDVLPEYYRKLENLKIGIKPKADYNFSKVIIVFNNTTGLASKEQSGVLQVLEQVLIAPAYTVFVKLNLEDDLHTKLDEYLQRKYAEFIPYLGKNEFHLWWDNYQEYQFEEFVPKESFKIDTLFIKEEVIKDKIEVELEDLAVLFESSEEEEKFTYFERLPIAYNYQLLQYDYKMFVYTNFRLKPSLKLGDRLYKVKAKSQEYVVQLF